MLVAQKVDVHKAGAPLSKTTVMFGDGLAVAPVAPGDPPLVANALRERLFAALRQPRPRRSAKPAPKCPP